MNRPSNPWVRALVPLALGLLVLLALGRLRVGLTTLDPEMQPAAPLAPLTGITSDVDARQEFLARADRIEAVSLYLATHARRNQGRLILSVEALEDTVWHSLARVSVRSADIADNQFHLFTFDPVLKVTSGGRVALRIRTTSDERNSLAWWITPGRRLDGYELSMNGQHVDGVARFNVYYAPRRGRLAGRNMGPLVWRRLTSLLGPSGKMLLVLAALSTLFGAMYLLAWTGREDLPGR